MLSLGIDIGGTSVKAALLREGRVVRAARSPGYRRPDADQLSLAIASTVSEVRSGADPDAVGLCMPGAWDDSRGVISRSVNVPGVEGIRPEQLVHRAGVDTSGVRVFTDAHAAAHDLFESESMADRLLAISIGTGVGAAVIDPGGTQLLVSGRSSGHLGQIDVTVPEADRDPPIGPDGGSGGLEAYIGLPALLARYGGDPGDLASRLRADHPPMLALAKAIRIAHAFYRPRHVRLLGGIGIRLAPLLPALRTRIEDRLTTLARPGWSFACGSDDYHAAQGAARLAARPG